MTTEQIEATGKDSQSPSSGSGARCVTPIRWAVYFVAVITTVLCVTDPLVSTVSYVYSAVLKDQYALYRMRVENARLEAANSRMKSELIALRTGRSKGSQLERRLDEKVATLENLIDQTTGLSVFKSRKYSDTTKNAKVGDDYESAAGKGKLAAILASPELPAERVPRKAAKQTGGVGGAEEPCRDALCRLGAAKEDILFAPSGVFNPRSAGNPSGLEERFERLLTVMRFLPLGAPALGEVSSGFGRRHSPFSRHISFHHGIDLSMPSGESVVATGAGVVKRVAYNRTYGTLIDIEHMTGLVTRYAHLAKTLVKAGEGVSRGQRIALSGSSGRSTGPHLHYEVIYQGRARNPQPFMQLADRLALEVPRLSRG